MDAPIRQYWVARLDRGELFAFPQLRKLGVDYRLKANDSHYWPTYVNKESLFLDYCAWAEKQPGAIRAMSDWYRQMGEFLMPFGKERHTRRFKTDIPMHVGSGRTMTGRKVMAFIKLPPLQILRAYYSLRMGHGVASERSAWGTLLKNAEQAFTTIDAPTTRQVGVPVV